MESSCLGEVGITLSPDGRLLFAARIVRMFSFGAITVVLLLFLAEVGFSDAAIGLCLTLILAGDLGITLALTTYADRVGRRRVLVLGAALKVAAGVAFALSANFSLTVLAGVLGVITPTGNDIGPFLAIEQAALTDITARGGRGEISTVFGWYQFVGASAQAAGAAAAGWSVSHLQGAGYSTLRAQQAVVLAYAAFGVLLGLLYGSLGVHTAQHCSCSSCECTRACIMQSCVWPCRRVRRGKQLPKGSGKRRATFKR